MISLAPMKNEDEAKQAFSSKGFENLLMGISGRHQAAPLRLREPPQKWAVQR